MRDCDVEHSPDKFYFLVSEEFLDGLHEEFMISHDVILTEPGLEDFPSRPPLGHVTLYFEFFHAGLRLPLHPFLRRALYTFDVCPA